MRLNTFSIVGHDPSTGMLGVAVSSKVLAVGAFCPYAQAGVGAIASQAYMHPYLGVDGLRLLAEGLAPTEVLDRLLREDPGRDWRQLAVVDHQGRSAAFTGKRTDAWSGHKTGLSYAAAGNLLLSGDTVEAMVETFEAARDEGLPERLLHSLEAGQAAGGDRRGRQSAALLVVNRLDLPYVDLRVDDHPNPVAELRRLFELGREGLFLIGKRISTTREPRGPEELEARQRLSQEMLELQEMLKEKSKQIGLMWETTGRREEHASG